MKAVIYARYSSDSQREESIEGQIRECTDYAVKNGITIISSYIDRALSARTADRPEFQRLIADSEKRLFDAVLVWKLDRFSRDRYDSALYKHLLRKNGVKVISAKENISEGPEGIILEAMLEGYAEYYSAELSQKIRRGQQENALKCKSNGGVIPFGYRIDPKEHTFVIDPEEAPIVKEIFSRYAAGEPMADIVASLNERGIKSHDGKDFRISVTGFMLKNRKYIGEYKYADVVVPGGMPAINSEELFERVQRRMVTNQIVSSKSKAVEEYLLTTKIFCGNCGKMMAGESGYGGKNKIYLYYKCGGAKRREGCTNRKGLRKNWIEKVAVMLTVQRVLSDDAVIERIADAIVALQDQEDPMLPAMRKQLKDCEKGIENLLNAIQAGIVTSGTKERLESLEAQKENLQSSILQAQLDRPKYTKEEIVGWILQFRGGNIEDKAYQKEIIDVFLNSIYVYEDRMVFTYNYKDGAETIRKEEIEAAFHSGLKNPPPPFTPDPEKGQGFLLFAAKIKVCTGKTGLFLRDRGSASKMNGLHKTAEIPLFPYRSLT